MHEFFFHLIFPCVNMFLYLALSHPISFLMVRPLVELEVFQADTKSDPVLFKRWISLSTVWFYPVDNAIRVSLILMYLIPIYLVDNAIQCLNNRRQVLKVFQTIQKNVICTSNNVMHFRSR